MLTSEWASASATKCWTERGPSEWARVLPIYWNAGAQPHRTALITAMQTLVPFESIRELGCCAGTNIKLMLEAFPKTIVQGVEVSYEATLYAQNKFVKDGRVGILHSDILDASTLWKPGEVDVVVSCYALAYIASDDLDGLLAAMVRSARVGIILIEPMMGEPCMMYASGGMIEWRHDYVNRLSRILTLDPRGATLESSQLPQAIELCDGAVRVKFLSEGETS